MAAGCCLIDFAYGLHWPDRQRQTDSESDRNAVPGGRVGMSGGVFLLYGVMNDEDD